MIRFVSYKTKEQIVWNNVSNGKWTWDLHFECVDHQEIACGEGVVVKGLSWCDSEHRWISGSCEYSDKCLGSIKCGEFLD
jgi:hypothetical protein